MPIRAAYTGAITGISVGLVRPAVEKDRRTGGRRAVTEGRSLRVDSGDPCCYLPVESAIRRPHLHSVRESRRHSHYGRED
jgi:hypothetical protein